MLDWEAAKTKRKPLGKLGPWVWAVEFVRGCNLACWHCTARVFPEDRKPKFMSKEVLEAMCKVHGEMTPHTRMEFGQCGEPTLHPELLDCIRTVKRISPTCQLQIYTNGVRLLKGEVTYDQLFEAGLNSVYVDMYGRTDEHMEMAEASGAEWYKYDKPKTVGTKGHRMANTYYGDPDMKLIILQDCPEHRLRWRKSGRLSTFLNHIDWKKSMPYGLVPVRKPYARKCTIPMRFVTVNFEGNYTFCCIDFVCEAAGLMGNVLEGADGFKRYWFGRAMQSIRRRLHDKDRAGVPYCARCNCAFSKCDWTKMWGGDQAFERWWDGESWRDLPLKGKDDEVFADGWSKYRAVQEGLPSVEEELECTSKSSKLIISSTIAAVRGAKKKKTSFGLTE